MYIHVVVVPESAGQAKNRPLAVRKICCGCMSSRWECFRTFPPPPLSFPQSRVALSCQKPDNCWSLSSSCMRL